MHPHDYWPTRQGYVVVWHGLFASGIIQHPQFFERLPLDRLIGPGLSAEDLNDDALGRALDRISDHGTTELFSTLAFTIIKQQGLLDQVNHLDSTSISLFGQYPPVSGLLSSLKFNIF